MSRANAATTGSTVRRSLPTFVAVAIPFVDVRTFLPLPSGMTGAIYWPDPPYGNEFVRGVGALRPRPRRGVTPWIGEGHFVDVRRGMRYGRTQAYGGDGSSLRPIYRRYFSDGVTGRVEVAFACARGSAASREAASEALDYPIRLGVSPGVAVELGSSGDSWASMLLRATTRVSQVDAVQNWWMAAGSPTTVVRHPTHLYGGSAAWTLLQRWEAAKGGHISHWSLYGPVAHQSRQEERQIRVHILRLHTEIEGLRTVLRLCRTDKLHVQDNVELQDYLETRTDFLLRRQFAGYEQRALMQKTLDAVGTGYSDELSTIEQTYALVRKGLARKLENLARILGAVPSGSAGSQKIIIMTGGTITMTDNSIEVGGNVGNVQGGTGNIQTIQALNQAITQGDNAGEILTKVLEFVGGLREQGVAEETVAEGEDLAEAAKNEAAKEQPDQSKLARWLDRLKGWAETVGEVAAPVLTAVGAVAKLIS